MANRPYRGNNSAKGTLYQYPQNKQLLAELEAELAYPGGSPYATTRHDGCAQDATADRAIRMADNPARQDLLLYIGAVEHMLKWAMWQPKSDLIRDIVSTVYFRQERTLAGAAALYGLSERQAQRINKAVLSKVEEYLTEKAPTRR